MKFFIACALFAVASARVFQPIAVGPAIVDTPTEFEPIHVGPAIIDFPLPDGGAASAPVKPTPSPVVVGPIAPGQPAPLVQLIVNINAQSPAPGAVVGPSEIPVDPVIVVDEAENVIAPSPVIIPEPVLPGPVIIEEPALPAPVIIVEPVLPTPVIVEPIEIVPVSPVIVETPIVPAPAVTLPETLN